MRLIDTATVYENPIPALKSRHGYFPGAVRLPDGTVVVLFAMGEAFESTDAFPYATRSVDGGRTWTKPYPLYPAPSIRTYSEYLKPVRLQNGTLLATGYRLYRENDEQPICNPETGGFCDSDLVLSRSFDAGVTWTSAQIITKPVPEMLEASGPCIQLASGTILGCGAVIPAWDGSNPSGPKGLAFSSKDGGSTWEFHDFMVDTELGIIPFESRLCETRPGTVVALSWAYAGRLQKNLANHWAVSHDEGRTWSKPTSTGITGQASNLHYLGHDRLLTVHSHRVDGKGLWVRMVCIKDNTWNITEELCVFGKKTNTSVGESTASTIQDQFTADLMSYGQPSILALDPHTFLIIHWAIIAGQGKILAHRITV